MFRREKLGDSTIKPNKSLDANAAEVGDDATSSLNPKASAFATAGLIDEIPEDDHGEGGGLMVIMFPDHLLALTSLRQSLIKSSGKSKKDKKQRAKTIDFDEDEEHNISHSASKVFVEMTANESIDEEWGSVKEKEKIDKKGKGKNTQASVDDEEDEQKGSHPPEFLSTFFVDAQRNSSSRVWTTSYLR